MQVLNQNAYPSKRWADAKVAFEIIDVDAWKNATATATSQAVISKIEQTHNDVRMLSQKTATLEQDLFLLDGTYILPNESNNNEIGYMSAEISDANKILTIPQILEFNFSQTHSSVGFTIVFDDKIGDCAEDFALQVYDTSNALLYEKAVTGNNLTTYIFDTPVQNYKKVKFTFTKTSKPFRRIKVVELTFGIIQDFESEDISNLKLLYEIDPTVENLSSNELTLTINNIDKKYNMINPTGIYNFLQQGQVIKVSLGIGNAENNIEFVNMGQFYYTSSTAEDDGITAKLQANDLFYNLSNSICRIGTTGTWTVNEAVNAVIVNSGVNIKTNIPANIGNRIIKKCIPQNTTHRDALKMIALSSMSHCFFNRNNELQYIEYEIKTNANDVLDNDNMYTVAKISDSGRINKIELVIKDEYAKTENIYTATNKTSDENDRIKTVNCPLANDGNAVANWLLNIVQKRIKYELQERGNPAREIFDTVKIYDAFNENRNALVTREEFLFDGILKANTKAIGGM